MFRTYRAMKIKKMASEKRITVANLHSCIRQDQTSCHKPTMRRRLPHPERECEIDPSLCVLYVVYIRAQGGGPGEIMCVRGGRERETAGEEARGCI